MLHIPDCPPALAPLLRRLYAEAETEISQHLHTPAPDAWYAGRVLGGTLGGGDIGPYASAEDALVALVRHVWGRCDQAEAEARALRAELARARQPGSRAG